MKYGLFTDLYQADRKNRPALYGNVYARFREVEERLNALGRVAFTDKSGMDGQAVELAALKLAVEALRLADDAQRLTSSPADR